jgi:FtsZ-binding cell division protein ZapB
MPISSWRYKNEEESIRHIGPTAQDFKAAFGLGSSDTRIATVDADGIALVAIKALKEENDRLKADSERLKSDNEFLKSDNDSLKSRLARIEKILGI